MAVGAQPHLRGTLRGHGGEWAAVERVTSAHPAASHQHRVDKCSTRGFGPAQAAVITWKKNEKKIFVADPNEYLCHKY